MIELNEKKISDLYDEIFSLDNSSIFYDFDVIRINAEIGIRTTLGKYLRGGELSPLDYKNIYKFNRGMELMGDSSGVSELEVSCLFNVFSNYSDEEVSILNNLYNENIDVMSKFNEGKRRVR